MANGIHVNVFIRRQGQYGIDRKLFDKIVRKITALLRRLGCTVHGKWELGEPE